MPSTLGLYGRQWLLRCAFRKEDAVGINLHVALTRAVADVGMDGTQLDEPSLAVNYGRVGIDASSGVWDINGFGEAVYNNPVQFPPPVGDWGLILGWALLSGQNLLATGSMTNPRRFGAGTIARLPANTIKVGLTD